MKINSFSKSIPAFSNVGFNSNGFITSEDSNECFELIKSVRDKYDQLGGIYEQDFKTEPTEGGWGTCIHLPYNIKYIIEEIHCLCFDNIEDVYKLINE